MLLYAHYDVQPPGDERLRRTPPFDPTEVDGAIYGRGVADDRSNVIVRVGALRAFGGRPPVGIKVVIEGQEYGSALIVLLHVLATLHDEHCDVASAGLRLEPRYTEQEFRELAQIEPEMPVLRTGSVGERLWSGSALTVVGIDAPSVEQAIDAVIPFVRAKLNLRAHPRQEAGEAQAVLRRPLEALGPFGFEAGNGFATGTTGPAYDAARAALKRAWGADPATLASGGSIRLLNALQKAVPDAEILLFGGEDDRCNLHAPNERVPLDELERAVVAEAEFFPEYAVRKGGLS